MYGYQKTMVKAGKESVQQEEKEPKSMVPKVWKRVSRTYDPIWLRSVLHAPFSRSSCQTSIGLINKRIHRPPTHILERREWGLYWVITPIRV